jgi:hypothetical protein
MNISSARKISANCDMVCVQFTDSDHLTTIDGVTPPDWYTAWLAAGNTPDPAPAPPVVTPPTPAEKLAAAGLTVEELKALLAS